MNLNITEIFYSLQGEGSASGYPFIFIRFAHCNLRCTYCDTGYSFDKGDEMSVKSVLEKISAWKNVDRVLITGGEPLLQKEGLLELVDALNVLNKKIFLETNGSIDISDIPKYVVKIVDIKTPSSGFGDSFILKNIDSLNLQDDLKIVIGSNEDFDFAVNYLKQFQLHKKCTVLFSPVSGRMDPEELVKWILALQLPVKLSLQIHKILNIK